MAGFDLSPGACPTGREDAVQPTELHFALGVGVLNIHVLVIFNLPDVHLDACSSPIVGQREANALHDLVPVTRDGQLDSPLFPTGQQPVAVGILAEALAF